MADIKDNIRKVEVLDENGRIVFLRTSADMVENELGETLEKVEAKAQENIIEAIKVNGVAQTIEDKTVDISVPHYSEQFVSDINEVKSQLVEIKEVSEIKGSVVEVAENIDAINTVLPSIDTIKEAVEMADEIGVGAKTALENAQKAEERAIKANEHAIKAEEQAEIATNKAQEVFTTYEEAMAVIEASKNSGIRDIANKELTSVANIEKEKEEAIETITSITTEGVDSLTSLIAEGSKRLEDERNAGVLQLNNISTASIEEVTSTVEEGKISIQVALAEGTSAMAGVINEATQSVKSSVTKATDKLSQKVNEGVDKVNSKANEGFSIVQDVTVEGAVILTELINTGKTDIERATSNSTSIAEEATIALNKQTLDSLQSVSSATTEGIVSIAGVTATGLGLVEDVAEEYVTSIKSITTEGIDVTQEAVDLVTSTATEGVASINILAEKKQKEIETISSENLNYIESASQKRVENINSIVSSGTSSISNLLEQGIIEVGEATNNSLTTISSTTDSAIKTLGDTVNEYNNFLQEEKQNVKSRLRETVEEVKVEADTELRDIGATIIQETTVSLDEVAVEAMKDVNQEHLDVLTSIDSAKDVAIKAVEDESASLINEASNQALEAKRQAEIALKSAEDSQMWAETSKTTINWGNLIGTLSDQEDLKITLNSKADGLLYEDGLLYLTCGGQIISEGIEVAAGGGGGGGGGMLTSVKLTNLLDKDEFFVAQGVPLVLSYLYEDSEELDGTVQYKVNNVTKHTARVRHGETVNFDVAPYLDEGYNYIQVRVVDLNNSGRSMIYIASVISIKMESTFDSTVTYTEPITFRYTPTGNVTKTIHFEIDGVELETEEITTSGRQQSKLLEFTHGVHSLRVWATTMVEEVEVISNILEYEVMYVEDTSVLISSDFNTTEYTEGETINIPMIVYNPNSLTTDVEVHMNGELVSTMNVGRTKFTWSRVANITGDLVITFKAGGAERTFNLFVKEANIHVDVVTENLQLGLSAMGRNNNDLDKTSWVYNDISCDLKGFNWITNGWINNALKISNGAAVTIPFKPFDHDFRTNGKTIEIEFSTSNVLDFNSIVATCMSGNRGFEITAQEAVFRSEQSQVDVKFKDDEKVRLAFVVENRSSNRLIYTYLNGIISGLSQYPLDDDFAQINPVEIQLGSAGCDIDLYNIRIYDTALNHYDILNNYIAGIADVAEKLKVYTANNVYDDYGNILYSKLINQIPIMTITGDLPAAKGDKKKVKVEYENQADETKNFVMENVTLDIQGTSSQYYPKKNYKISKLPEAYALRTGAVPEKVFTLKADYMESSHAHNTGLARLVGSLYETLTPPQEENPGLRTTIDGFPIAMFYRATEEETPKYFGVYNFNNDKSSNDTFGFTEGCESWEFCNNTSDRCLFLTDDFENSTDVLTDFEARFPDGHGNYSNLQALVTWVYSCYQDRESGGVERFKTECENHFNLEYLLTYYVVSEFFGMVDSRAKNMFLNLYNDGHWYPVFYDLDTAIGLNNEGVNDFNFDIESHDSRGTENIYNGKNSGLWYLVEQAYRQEIEDLYNKYRNSGALSYQTVMKYLYEDQIAKICEAQYNADADFKYISPLVEDGIATYLYTAQGSRLDHMKWWIHNRFNYMDSRYTASEYKSNYLTLRLYTPSTWQDVEPSANITVTPYADQYVRIKYGSYDVYTRAKSGEQTTIVPPPITFNDTETILYGASRITSIGDMAPLYAGTIDVSGATKLTHLKIGEGGNYSNTNLKSLTLGNNTLLQDLDIRNCPSLSGALDISGCTNIKKIRATGTALTSVKLAEAGNITDLELPETITNLTVKNQNSIENFVCGNNITTLVLENTNLDSLDLFIKNPITKVRLIGVDWALEDFTLLDQIYALTGQDEIGNNTSHGIVAGTIRMSNVKESVVNEYRKKFIGLDFIVEPYALEDYISTDFGQAITTHDGFALLYTGITR